MESETVKTIINFDMESEDKTIDTNSIEYQMKVAQIMVLINQRNNLLSKLQGKEVTLGDHIKELRKKNK